MTALAAARPRRIVILPLSATFVRRAQLVVLAAFLVVRPWIRAADPDFWWHLRTGDLIVHHGIPARDPFSWTAAGQPWVAHEWLSEAFIYLAQSTLGYAVTAMLFGMATCASLVLMYQLGRVLGGRAKSLLMLAVVSVAILGIFAAVRPQVFTWLLFAAFVSILARDERRESVPLWALPPLMVLWVNLHLGFVYGLLAVTAWAGARAYGRIAGDRRPLGDVLLVLAGCVLAVAANPAGFALYAYPLRYIQDAHSLGIVAEWQRPNPLMPLAWPYFLAAMLLAYSLCSEHRPRPFLLLLSIAVLIISLQAVRNMPFVALLLPAVAGRALSATEVGEPRRRIHGLLRASVVTAVVIAAGVTMMAVLVGRPATLSLGSPAEAGTPSGGAFFVEEHYPSLRLFNDYNWGGYLIYKVPDVPVFIDGRTDFYRSKIIDDYTTIGTVDTGWSDLVDAYGIDVMLLRPNSHLARVLRGEAGWDEVYAGSDSSVFVRDGMPQR